MQVKLKQIVSVKFGVTLYPDRAYSAEKVGERYRVHFSDVVSVLVDKKDCAEVN